MSSRCFSIGVLSIRVRYLLIRPEGFYYQRRVPRDLQQHYPSPRIRESLGTAEPREAARLIQRINSKHEADWRALREKGEPLPPQALHKPRSAIGSVGVADRLWIDDLGVAAFTPSETLSDPFFFTQARDLYLRYHPKGDQEDFIKDTNYSCDIFLDVCGDLPITEITRGHAHTYLDHVLRVSSG